MKIRLCCGKEFYPYHGLRRIKYCSVQYANSINRKTKITDEEKIKLLLIMQ